MKVPGINLYNYHLLGIVQKLHSRYTQHKPRQPREQLKPEDFLKQR